MKIVAVTSCPSGVAHTYLSAEALETAAKKRGDSIQVETQGSIGVENKLNPEAIQEANIVILTSNSGINGEERFKGKPVVRFTAADLISKSDMILEKLEEKLKIK